MLILGLTGNIGSGKSMVAHYLEKLGAVVIDADILAREVVEPGKPALLDIQSYFGEDFLNADGSLNRKLLALRVFNSPADLLKLNEITHPRISQALEEYIKNYQAQGKEAVVYEAALIFEKNFSEICDCIWVVAAPEESILGRLQLRDGLSPEEGRLRLNSQMSFAEMSKRADEIIINDGSLEDLYAKVKSLYEVTLAKYRK